jgi:hypothetical protein
MILILFICDISLSEDFLFCHTVWIIQFPSPVVFLGFSHNLEEICLSDSVTASYNCTMW